MVDEKKVEKKVEKTEEVKQEYVRGPSGETGKPTAGLTMKQRWHEATHLLEERGDKTNPHRQGWLKKAGTPSLKRYARQLAASGDAMAKEWLSNKSGALNETRSEKNAARIALEKMATKSARRKKSQKGGKSTTTTDATTVKAK